MPNYTPQPANSLPVSQIPRVTGNIIPERLYMFAPGMKANETRLMADHAASICRTLSPRLSGRAAEGIKPYSGEGFFGVRWSSSYLWYQEGGTGAHTMRKLAGKVIPMWVDDWTGEMKRRNPKAKTRITANGRRQILIFRKAAKMGARKRLAVRDPQGRLLRWRSVPQSYPGAPGRIAIRQWKPPNSTTGKIALSIDRPNVGVRWRHPGIVPREFMQHAILHVGLLHEIEDREIYAVYGRR